MFESSQNRRVSIFYSLKVHSLQVKIKTTLGVAGKSIFTEIGKAKTILLVEVLHRIGF